MKRAGRLQAARHWLAGFEGKKLVRSYARHFGVDLRCAIKVLQMLGVTFATEYLKALEETLAARERAPARPADTALSDDDPWMPGDEQFALIVGRTEGGAAYGVTWEEMAALDAELAEPDRREPGHAPP